jgi:hypothetical protein
MTRLELVKRMAESATRPLAAFEPAAAAPEIAQALHQPVDVQPADMQPTEMQPAETQPAETRSIDSAAPAITRAPAEQTTDLFVWFEDTSHRSDERRGIAGLPEALLPWPFDGSQSMQVIARRYAEGHMHLLAAVRLRCTGKFGERIAALYTSALSVGTVAWIGTGSQYEQAWRELYG